MAPNIENSERQLAEISVLQAKIVDLEKACLFK